MTDQTTTDEPDETGDDEVAMRPFAAWLREVQNGRTHDEATTKLAEVVEAVAETGKAGKLTLTFTIKPMKGNTDVLLVEDAVVSKAPQHDRKASIFYPDEHGNLTRTDPHQPELEGLRAAADPTAEQPKQRRSRTS